MTDLTPESTVKLLGWINLGLAAMMFASARAVPSARTWARVVGGLFGAVTIVNGLQNLDLNVFWGIAGIAAGAAIIIAVSVKGPHRGQGCDAARDHRSPAARRNPERA